MFFSDEKVFSLLLRYQLARQIAMVMLITRYLLIPAPQMGNDLCPPHQGFREP
jgi:hypothetical protein